MPPILCIDFALPIVLHVIIHFHEFFLLSYGDSLSIATMIFHPHIPSPYHTAWHMICLEIFIKLELG